MECGQVLVELAVHVLGGLEPVEARAVEDHLAACPRCTAERDRHAEVAGLMGRVRAWEVAPDAPVHGPGPERAVAVFRSRERDRARASDRDGGRASDRDGTHDTGRGQA
ncbi:zf-HC2 domain-containing protein [Streptomyces sp. NA02950]|uniref:zf-HC2 domain-containing protein n=1 Tax=Streptomyces sp. NA02950 TaxID=2742137 RepID=UPI001590BAF5|nr:zf-HC2 domain-containing protein [Streptomyces sp. NA02950]QKV96802.1 zf-HC2 domain-containing protein [Streptomyces sp. NA02950]